MTEGEMVGWHNLLNGHEFEQTLADSEGQGSLVCCSPQGRKGLDKPEQPNNKNVHSKFVQNVEKHYDSLRSVSSPSLSIQQLPDRYGY